MNDLITVLGRNSISKVSSWGEVCPLHILFWSSQYHYHR